VSTTLSIFLFAGITAVSTLLGGLFALRYKKALFPIIGFAAGVLVATAFVDLLPEIFCLLPPTELNVRWVMTFVVLGFISFHCLEKFTLWHACGEGENHFEHHQTVGILGACGLSLHSLFDGVAIGVAFHSSMRVGIFVSTAVTLHKFSDGLSMMGILAINKNTVKTSLLWLGINAVCPLVGAFSTFAFSMTDNTLALFLAFFAGLFLYIGASDLLPEAHRVGTNKTTLLATIGGILVVFIVTAFFKG